MNLATVIRLPLKRTPLFPQRCVVCGYPCDSETVAIRSRGTGYYGMFTWLFRKTQSFIIPAHPKCGVTLKRRLSIQRLLLFALVTAVIVVVLYFHFSKVQAVLLVLLVTAPAILWEELSPPPLDIAVQPRGIDFEFADPEYAGEFASLNEASEQVNEPAKSAT